MMIFVFAVFAYFVYKELTDTDANPPRKEGNPK